jgi:hypothetical protein
MKGIVMSSILDHLKKNNRDKLKSCTHCESTDFILKMAINEDGKECYPYFCEQCDFRSPIVEKKSIAYKLGFMPYVK